MKNNRGTHPELTDKELVARKSDICFCDVEIYSNYFLIVFYFKDGKISYFEGIDFNRKKLLWILENFEIVTFNGIYFDIPVILYFLYRDPSIGQIQTVADEIITYNLRPYELYKKYKIPQNGVKINHIDLKEVCIGQSSLKTYAGRIHAPYMQDLPYDPYSSLNEKQMDEVLKYCINDCINTKLLLDDREKEMNLRRELTIQYSSDCRSKSDAQIAEVVLARELEWRHGVKVTKTSRPLGYTFKYKTPSNISFKTEKMKKVLEVIENSSFYLSDSGKVKMPDEIKALKIAIGGSVYQMGIGGLHSTEKKVTLFSGNQYELYDRDVASYYPRIILNQELYPDHIGKAFLSAYRGIVERRLEAKAAGDKSVADTLKIVINGSFGKFGSPYSFLFSPELLIQTTVSGQLYLLMLIEELELQGFSVASANTDGIVTQVGIGRKEEFDAIVEEWETKTGFQTEETKYLRLQSRDVNNYIAIKDDYTIKSKGAYGDDAIGKNPAGQIIFEAVRENLLNGTDVDETIRKCDDIRKFVFIRKVNGGCVDAEGNDIGKVIRYYYQKGQFFPLRYKTSGNKVPRTDGATPFMDLTVDFPQDIDYNRYSYEAKKILNSDFSKPEQMTLFD